MTVEFVAAHDFWLVPDAFHVAANADVVARGQTSSAFPTSESAVTRDRITAARIVGASDEETVRALTTRGTSLVLRHRPRTAGQKIVAVSVGWRNTQQTDESRRKYLLLEGAADALKRYEQAGLLPTAGIVRRCVKIRQDGRRRSDPASN